MFMAARGEFFVLFKESVLEVGPEDMMTVLHAVDDGRELAAHTAVQACAEDLGDLVGGQSPQAELAAPFEQLVDRALPIFVSMLAFSYVSADVYGSLPFTMQCATSHRHPSRNSKSGKRKAAVSFYAVELTPCATAGTAVRRCGLVTLSGNRWQILPGAALSRSLTRRQI
jgi:hypothetical protein